MLKQEKVERERESNRGTIKSRKSQDGGLQLVVMEGERERGKGLWGTESPQLLYCTASYQSVHSFNIRSWIVLFFISPPNPSNPIPISLFLSRFYWKFAVLMKPNQMRNDAVCFKRENCPDIIFSQNSNLSPHLSLLLLVSFIPSNP